MPMVLCTPVATVCSHRYMRTVSCQSDDIQKKSTEDFPSFINACTINACTSSWRQFQSEDTNWSMGALRPKSPLREGHKAQNTFWLLAGSLMPVAGRMKGAKVQKDSLSPIVYAEQQIHQSATEVGPLLVDI